MTYEIQLQVISYESLISKKNYQSLNWFLKFALKLLTIQTYDILSTPTHSFLSLSSLNVSHDKLWRNVKILFKQF